MARSDKDPCVIETLPAFTEQRLVLHASSSSLQLVTFSLSSGTPQGQLFNETSAKRHLVSGKVHCLSPG